VADMLADGASWLTSQLKAAAGRSVTYRRAGEEVDVIATIGESRFEAAGQSGVLEQWESRDYLISTADLPFGDPERGDRIVEVQAGEVVEYECSSPRGVPEWHYGDAFRSIVRVHTTQVQSGTIYLVTELGEQLITESGDVLTV